MLLVCLLAGLGAWAQTIDTNYTYARHIAPIINKNCTGCHNPNGLKADLPLNSYKRVFDRRHLVSYMVTTRQMPPWPPDPAYSRQLHERALSNAEITAIQKWVQNGAQAGDTSQAYSKTLLEPTVPRPKPQPDLVVSMAQRWVHQGNNKDGHRVFVIPVQIPADKYLKMAEFKAGNPRIAHHAVIAIDTTNQAVLKDNASPGYGYAGSGVDFGFNPTVDNYALWVPGAMPIVYPDNIGKPFFRNCKVLIMMHYAPTTTTDWDSSTVSFYFHDRPVNRTIFTGAVTPMQIVNGPFFIPANSKRIFEARLTIPNKLTLIEYGAHSHLLGKNWQIFAIRPGNDTVKVLSIPHWDFHWQGMYMPPRAIVLPAGTIYVARATYDNTVANPHNPFNPPRDIGWGSNTTDEMFVQYNGFLAWEPGDDTLNMGPPPRDLTAPLPGTVIPAPPVDPAKLVVYRADMNMVRYYSPEAGMARVAVLDRTGAEVATAPGIARLGLSYISLDISTLAAGLYEIRVYHPNGTTSSTWYQQP